MIRVLLIAPYQELVVPFTQLFAEHTATTVHAEYADEDFELSSVVVSRISELKSLKFNAEIIVSRGYVAAEVRRLNFYVPIVEIPIASIDLLQCLHRAGKQFGCDRAVVIGSPVMVMDVDRIAELVPIQVLAYVAETSEEIREAVGRAAAEGIPAVVGGAVACESAQSSGLHGLLVESGRESIWHSITEAKRLAYLVRRERERMEHFSGLVAGVAHEVNTPLGVSVSAASFARGALEAVKAGYASGSMDESSFISKLDASTEAMGIIESNLEKAVEFIRTFKQISADQAVADLREIDLGEYIRGIVLSLRPKLKRTPHAVEIECPDDLRIETNPGAIYQILTNFIVNSLMHAFVGEVPGHMLISARRIPGAVEIVYRDDGKGIEPDVLGRIFDPFFTTARNRGGSGLGLYISRNIALKLGGEITCASGTGKGVQFTVTLPITQAGEENDCSGGR
ncbi:MAG: hypothetical protein A2Z99_17870 [Treponema sp. GWB1_62_6]|nr:MAG: hypothetical protein A2Y36_08010 [Treponema sp. GWA1_62_8]OHE64895.1 MAG: hypothetical protein A2001_16420 [Treponema sp. GWC1_61_84]OHE65042.1 MAG: hypothetical protein A2Z99_17870 [Treponema sp. GWB1_62_6]HCM28861.1 hypothetical protein [Treponema sp.]